MKRRQFVSTLAGGTLLAGIAPGCVGASVRKPVATNVGIQLYTLRTLMGTDPAGTLAAPAQIGYREVELHSLYRLTAQDFRKLLDANGLTAPATHVGINLLRRNLQKVLDDGAALGHRWLIVPSLEGADRTREGYQRVAEYFNQIGPQVKQAGFRLGYHNHEYELATADGVAGLDLL